MKTVAEITDGRVTNIARIKDDTPIPEGWVECTGVACIGDKYDGQAFTTPAAPAAAVIPFEQAKAQAMAEVKATHASYLRQATDNATPEERDTWPAKSAAATAYLAGTATAAQIAFMGAAAARDGVTPDALAQTIITKADAFLGHIGQADDLSASGRAAVEAATTHDALQAALDAFEAEAQLAFDALGAEGG